MSFFYRFVAASLADDFSNPEPGKLSPYTAVFIFSLGVYLSNFLWNTIFMYRPLYGAPVSYKQYFQDGNARLHLVGILGGAIWCLGMFLSILSSDVASPAISYGLYARSFNPFRSLLRLSDNHARASIQRLSHGFPRPRDTKRACGVSAL